MGVNMDRIRASFVLGIMVAGLWLDAGAQGVDASAQIHIKHDGMPTRKPTGTPTTVLLWLIPVPNEGERSEVVPPARPGSFRMIQKNKAFEPHLLVVPLGSTVSFPNLDPFFHNVFSQFNGKRFDLGLYEAGGARDVQFNHEGVSYLFCNIHPAMSAVVVTLSTPYFAVAKGDTVASIHDLPAGMYDLHVWAEGFDSQQLEACSRRVHIVSPRTNLGLIELTAPASLPSHKNKFGEDYRPDHPGVY